MVTKKGETRYHLSLLSINLVYELDISRIWNVFAGLIPDETIINQSRVRYKTDKRIFTKLFIRQVDIVFLRFHII